jgi:hypothetical protein
LLQVLRKLLEGTRELLFELLHTALLSAQTAGTAGWSLAAATQAGSLFKRPSGLL